MPTKQFINKTGFPLTVTLAVRQGDHPDLVSDRVTVDLGSGDASVPAAQEVAYGDETHRHLNAIVIGSVAGLAERTIPVVRGSGLDRAIDGKNAVEFLFDGQTILVSCIDPEPPSFAFTADDGETA